MTSKDAHKGKRPQGRPTLYRSEYDEQARKLARLGATDPELAEFFGVNVDTIYEWKKVHASFSDAIKDGKFIADAEVADKLFKRATGYEHQAVKIVADAKTGAEHSVEYTERYPPDTTAAIFWLKNRRPDLWRDRVEQQLSGPGGGAIPIQSTVTFVRPPEREQEADE